MVRAPYKGALRLKTKSTVCRGFLFYKPYKNSCLCYTEFMEVFAYDDSGYR